MSQVTIKIYKAIKRASEHASDELFIKCEDNEETQALIKQVLEKHFKTSDNKQSTIINLKPSNNITTSEPTNYITTSEPTNKNQNNITNAESINVEEKNGCNKPQKKKKGTKKSSLQCKECGKQLKTYSNLTQHKVNHHNGVYTCATCKTMFKERQDYRLHLASHPKEFECTICGKAFNTKVILKNHSIRHQRPQHMCDYCRKRFKLPHQLKIHIEKKGHQTIQCEKCNGKFRSKKALAKHEEKHILDHEKVALNETIARPSTLASALYNCTMCISVFSNENHWKLHKLTHLGVPLRCHQCKTTYRVEQNFFMHMRSMHNPNFTADAFGYQYVDPAANVLGLNPIDKEYESEGNEMIIDNSSDVVKEAECCKIEIHDDPIVEQKFDTECEVKTSTL